MRETIASRRTMLGGLVAGLGIGLGVSFLPAGSSASAKGKRFPISKSKAEWSRLLTKDEYYVLRQAGTERPFSSPLNDEKRKGVFVCAGCKNRLYSSRTKYDSRTGWPSFYAAIEKGAVGTSTDYKIGYPRTEVHCADCGGHLGHIFKDGPKPTGQRHCINGVAMDFIPA